KQVIKKPFDSVNEAHPLRITSSLKNHLLCLGSLLRRFQSPHHDFTVCALRSPLSELLYLRNHARKSLACLRQLIFSFDGTRSVPDAEQKIRPSREALKLRF